MKKDVRREKEEWMLEALKEIHDKGFTKERGEEYQRRQTEWWNECDVVAKKARVLIK